jgi:hypothetical protein
VYNNLFTKYAKKILNNIITPEVIILKLILLKLVTKNIASFNNITSKPMKNMIEIIKK